MIITKSISRFARNTLDCLYYVRMLKSLPSPVSIYFEKENIDTMDSKSELLLTILSSIAQDESRSISENVIWSSQKRFQKGIAHCPTLFFLGYDTDAKGHLTINEEQAKTVRRIYKQYLEGDGVLKIANSLNSEGIKTGQGKTNWYSQSVLRILKNEKHCGDVLMQKRVTLNFLTHKRTENKGDQPQYFVANHHPAIISRDEWNAVQTEIKRRSQLSWIYEDGTLRKNSDRFTFSNKLYCGTCGHLFMRRSAISTKNNNKYLYRVWKCKVADGRARDEKCNAICYREDSIEHAFMSGLLGLKRNIKALDCEIREIIKGKNLEDWELKALNSLEIEIHSLEWQQNQIAETSVRDPRDVYDDNISFQLSLEIENRQEELDILYEKRSNALMLESKLEWFTGQLVALNDFNPAFDRTLFREDIFEQIIERGTVHNDGSIVYESIFGVTFKVENNNLLLNKVDRNNKERGSRKRR